MHPPTTFQVLLGVAPLATPKPISDRFGSHIRKTIPDQACGNHRRGGKFFWALNLSLCDWRSIPLWNWFRPKMNFSLFHSIVHTPKEFIKYFLRALVFVSSFFPSNQTGKVYVLGNWTSIPPPSEHLFHSASDLLDFGYWGHHCHPKHKWIGYRVWTYLGSLTYLTTNLFVLSP